MEQITKEDISKALRENAYYDFVAKARRLIEYELFNCNYPMDFDMDKGIITVNINKGKRK